ncbi:PAS domain-containing protein [Altererythrobacter sp. CAU 1778]
MDQARIALTISSCAIEDQPLIYVNQRFCDLSGYAAEEIIGQNCRFLQQDLRSQDARFRMRRFITGETSKRQLRCSLVNFRKDGSPFVNLVYLSQIAGEDGKTRYIFASQFDATARAPEQLAEYDEDLAKAHTRVGRFMRDQNMIMDQSIDLLASAAANIAQTKLTLNELTRAG